MDNSNNDWDNYVCSKCGKTFLEQLKEDPSRRWNTFPFHEYENRDGISPQLCLECWKKFDVFATCIEMECEHHTRSLLAQRLSEFLTNGVGVDGPHLHRRTP
jgi:DNA-directed RNA polymerase subunit RPC12/RpoP